MPAPGSPRALSSLWKAVAIGSVAAWHLAASVLIVVWPVYAFHGTHSRLFFREHWFATIGPSVCYLLAIVTAHFRPQSKFGNVRAVVTVFTWSLGAYSLVLLAGGVAWPRSILIAAGSTGLALVLLSALVSARWLLLAALTCLVLGLIYDRRVERPAQDRATEVRPLYTRYESFRVAYFHGYLPQGPTTGGGFSAVGNRLFVLTGDGNLAEVVFSSDPKSESLTVSTLPYRVPLNGRQFVDSALRRRARNTFRAAGLLVTAYGGRLQFYVMHHSWNEAHQCYTMKLSVIERPVGAVQSPDGPGWRTVYETRPCLSLRGNDPSQFSVFESGGRLIEMDADHLLVTVGDHEYDGVHGSPAQAQDPESDYGKTLVINVSSGQRTLFSTGHRNPQGLHRDPQGRLWLTEQGPAGGDELNELRPRANYGWPLVTYGTNYGATTWPPSATPGEHTGFTPPTFSWLPSIAASSVVVVRGPSFQAWDGDFLVASLHDQSLHRLRLREGRVMFDERIPIGRRLRDIVQLDDDRIVLLADNRSIISLRPIHTESAGARAFAVCASCHPIGDGRSHGIGPDLFGVYLRQAGTGAGFSYSSAMRESSSRWTSENLDRFLENPSRFLPGTTMEFPGLPDATERQLVINHLLEAR